MGKVGRAIMLAMCMLLLAACRYETLDQAIEEGIPFNIQQMVHMEKLKEGTLVLYTTKQKDGAERVDALGAAFIEGNSKDGWENVGHNHWIYEKNDFMMQYKDVFHVYSPDGKLEVKVPFLFGKINSPKITKVEVAKSDKKFSEAKVIKKGKERYYYAIGDYQFARGLAKDGKELNRQGK